MYKFLNFAKKRKQIKYTQYAKKQNLYTETRSAFDKKIRFNGIAGASVIQCAQKSQDREWKIYDHKFRAQNLS